MKWIIHQKVCRDKQVQSIVSHLIRMDIEYYFADVIPFSSDGIQWLDGYPDRNDKVFSYGSYTLANIATKHFSPGAFLIPSLNMSGLISQLGDLCMNYDSQISELSEIKLSSDRIFVRPNEDTKSFSGSVMTADEFNGFRQLVIESSHIDQYSTITPSTVVCVSPIKKIQSEYRCFIVNGRVCTASQYKMNGEPFFWANVDECVIEFANFVATKIKEQCYVLDIAIVDGKPYVLEANCINSSGLYKIDTQKLVAAIENI